jgi:hypothetical protein
VIRSTWLTNPLYFFKVERWLVAHPMFVSRFANSTPQPKEIDQQIKKLGGRNKKHFLLFARISYDPAVVSAQ